MTTDRRHELRAFLSGSKSTTREIESTLRTVVGSRHYRIDPSDREDIVQSALVDLWTTCSSPDFELQRSLGGLARRIAMARCVDWVRARRHTEPLFDDLRDPADDALETLDRRQQVERLQEALARLRPFCQDLIRRHLYLGQRYAQIATDLGRNESTLRVHMFKCLRTLRQQFGIEDA